MLPQRAGLPGLNIGGAAAVVPPIITGKNIQTDKDQQLAHTHRRRYVTYSIAADFAPFVLHENKTETTNMHCNQQVKLYR